MTVEALWNHGERPIAQVRQDLLAHSRADYVCFVDDDDLVAENYVAAILPLLDGVDYVGFSMSMDFLRGRLSHHSLRYGSWYDTTDTSYRDITHLNPIRRDLALRGSFAHEPSAQHYGEDQVWAEQVRSLVKTEHVVSQVLYFNLVAGRSSRERPLGEILAAQRSNQRLDVASPYFSWHPRSSRARR